MAGPDKNKIINLDLTRDKKNNKANQELQFHELSKKQKKLLRLLILKNGQCKKRKPRRN